MTDDELMIQIQSGSNEAFSQLVERYQGALIGFFMRKTRDIQLSEDLAQDTLLKVHNQSWNYLPHGQFKGWMFRIARNLFIDDYRKQNRDALVQACKMQSKEDDDAMARISEEILGPDERVQNEEFSQLVTQLLQEIPEDQRETFCLHHFESLSLAEVAETMDVALATSKSRLRLAREKLAEKLRARGFAPTTQI